MTEMMGMSDEMLLGADQDMLAQTKRLLADSGSFLLLPDEIWQAGEEGRLPLERMLLELPLEKWIVMVSVLDQRRSAQHWDFVRMHLAGIRTRNDIRYDYLEMHMSNFWVSGVLQADSAVAVERLLCEYAEANMRYAREVYNPIAFEEALAFMPDSVRGAFWVEKALACAPEDNSGKLEYLRKAVKEWHALGSLIKSYAQFLGEEDERREQEKAAAVSNEMAAIAVEVKKQILNLMDSGMYADAYSVTEELQQMMPGDADLEALKAELKGHFS